MNKIYLFTLIVGILTPICGCEKFLDTLPDNRTELDTPEKISAILTSAYPNKCPKLMMQYGSDNFMDLGKQHGTRFLIQQEAYLWQDMTAMGNDNTRFLWQTHYSAISNANQALEAIDNLGNPSSLSGQRAEALMCRAYAHYILSTIFCKEYNPETADKDMGIPYSESPENKVIVNYTRGTMAELYAKIDKDIEEALPHINDDLYTVPKYHFNQKAAYAFAARFKLFYIQKNKSNYTKAIEYADKALGVNPRSLLRDYTVYLPLGAKDIANKYPQASESANFLILPVYSIAARRGGRYALAREIMLKELYWAQGPWEKSGSNNFLYWARKLYNWGEGSRFPKCDEFWEESGFAHVVTVPFTSDETLLVRAEAKVMLEQYDQAMADLSLWYTSHCLPEFTYKGKKYTLPKLTREKINTFFAALPYAPVVSTVEGGKDRSIKKVLHPQGFTVSEGEQENFIHCVLHFRRLETLFEGQRWIDIKRYGIEVGHNRDNMEADILKVGDPRRVFQLPIDVIKAGLQANPR